jgi:type II pantothenate kinase
MSLAAGIDMGGTNTHGVVLRDGRVWRKASLPGNGKKEAAECFRRLARGMGRGEVKVLKLMLTGGGARNVEKNVIPIPFSIAGEIEAIGRGGVFLSGKRDVFVVSMGTGTAFVSVKGGKAIHLGGTGMGGGTVMGLSCLMLDTDPDGAEEIARSAGRTLDVTVADIAGSGIGKIPGSATASNFGKACGKCGEPEVAASMFRMVSESVGVMAYFAAKSVGQEGRVLICGRVPVNAIVRKRILYTVGMFGGKAAVPKNAEYCAAIGAALSAGTLSSKRKEGK